MNKSSLFGLALCGLVTYFGIMHGMSMGTLFNSHALILVIGGTIAIAILSYPMKRLKDVLSFINKGFLFKTKNSDIQMIEDLIISVKSRYGNNNLAVAGYKPHPFIQDSLRLLDEPDLSVNDVAHILKSRKDAVKKRYFEDAKILNNIAKYPPHLGLLGASSGMIQMMAGLGKGGIETIGAAMAVALTATLWGIFLNNFIFLPLSDNATKAAEDEMYFREIVCESMIMLKSNMQEKVVTEIIVSRLMSVDRLAMKFKIAKMKDNLGSFNAA